MMKGVANAFAAVYNLNVEIRELINQGNKPENIELIRKKVAQRNKSNEAAIDLLKTYTGNKKNRKVLVNYSGNMTGVEVNQVDQEFDESNNSLEDVTEDIEKKKLELEKIRLGVDVIFLKLNY